ncbi:hypothetical protein DL98DRAFT_522500 [Cadophora sp. DSE1049]|nr:hypothetical protein DL98DRAFT_522500 [Cadophora sp. DSE1049]
MQISFFALLAIATTALACSQGEDCCWADLTACEQENGDDSSACHTRDFIFAQCENFGVECADGDCCSIKSGEVIECV